MTISLQSINQIGNLIRTERKRQKINQQDLADLSGVSLHFLSNIENGKETVEFKKLIQVLNSLGINILLKTRVKDSTDGA